MEGVTRESWHLGRCEVLSGDLFGPPLVAASLFRARAKLNCWNDSFGMQRRLRPPVSPTCPSSLAPVWAG